MACPHRIGSGGCRSASADSGRRTTRRRLRLSNSPRELVSSHQSTCGSGRRLLLAVDAWNQLDHDWHRQSEADAAGQRPNSQLTAAEELAEERTAAGSGVAVAFHSTRAAAVVTRNGKGRQW